MKSRTCHNNKTTERSIKLQCNILQGTLWSWHLHNSTSPSGGREGCYNAESPQKQTNNTQSPKHQSPYIPRFREMSSIHPWRAHLQPTEPTCLATNVTNPDIPGHLNVLEAVLAAWESPTQYQASRFHVMADSQGWDQPCILLLQFRCFSRRFYWFSN